ARRELALADQHHLTIVPVKVEEAAPNDPLAYALATRSWIDTTPNWDAGMDQIAGGVGASGVAQPAVAAPPPPVQPAAVVAPAPAQPQVVYVPYAPPAPPRSHAVRNVFLTIFLLLVLV